MSKIFFCGDLHGEYRGLIAAVLQHKPDAIVLLGDIMGDFAERSLDQELADILDKTEVWWIHGNHDTGRSRPCDLLFDSSLADRNLHGRVAEVAGVRIAGLGGVFRGRIWYPPAAPKFHTLDEYLAHAGGADASRSSGMTAERRARRDSDERKHRSSIFPEDYRRLVAQHADVLVTHEAPDCHPYGYAALTELAQTLGVQSSFHGHQHDNLDYSAHRARLGFAAHGVGLRGITDLSGKVIVEGDLDQVYQQKAEAGIKNSP